MANSNQRMQQVRDVPCPSISQICVYNSKLKRLNKKKRIQQIVIQKMKMIFQSLNFGILNMQACNGIHRNHLEHLKHKLK
jgi:hypothetical protein